MRRHEPIRVHHRRLAERFTDLPGIRIEYGRRQRDAPRNRKRVAGEKHALAGRKETYVTGRVTRDIEDGERERNARHVDAIALCKPLGAPRNRFARAAFACGRAFAQLPRLM